MSPNESRGVVPRLKWFHSYQTYCMDRVLELHFASGQFSWPVIECTSSLVPNQNGIFFHGAVVFTKFLPVCRSERSSRLVFV